MADDLERRRIFLGDDGEFRVVVDDERRVDELVVDAAGDRRLGQTRANTRGDIGHAHGLFEILLAAVRQRNGRHRDFGIRSSSWKAQHPASAARQNQFRQTRGSLADIGAGARAFLLKSMKSPSRSARPVRFAVVGLGHIAQAAVLPAFKHARPHVELTALVSDTPAKLKALGRRYGVKQLYSYDDARDLFASGDIDAVYIALPNTLHAAWTIRAADAGLHVLCEKPLATSVRDCERMIEACERNGVQLMTAYRLHFERCNLEVADIVRKKRIGDARYFDSQFSMQVKAGNIRLERELGGGPEWDIGIYCQNAARYVFADEPTQVWATATQQRRSRASREVPETVHVIMKFPARTHRQLHLQLRRRGSLALRDRRHQGQRRVRSGVRIRRGPELRAHGRREEEAQEIREERSVRARSSCTSPSACAPTGGPSPRASKD